MLRPRAAVWVDSRCTKPPSAVLRAPHGPDQGRRCMRLLPRRRPVGGGLDEAAKDLGVEGRGSEGRDSAQHLERRLPRRLPEGDVCDHSPSVLFAVCAALRLLRPPGAPSLSVVLSR